MCLFYNCPAYFLQFKFDDENWRSNNTEEVCFLFIAFNKYLKKIKNKLMSHLNKF